MRLKIFMLCIVALFVSQTSRAQWVVTDPGNLAQGIINATKNIVHTSSTASTMIQNFQETVKIYKQGKEYYDALKKVKNLVRDARKSLMLALSQDLEQNRPVEAREHVKRFHELFFTLSPDKSAIESNIQRAMSLADRSAYEHYSDLAEQGYYNRIISGNVNQRVEIDSVKCDFNVYPYDVVTYARLSIVREKSVTERSLVTMGRLLNSTRSDNNPHGFILESFRVEENKDLRVYDR